jgi:hypothetical protein
MDLMENGKWKMENGKWKMENEKHKAGLEASAGNRAKFTG